MTHSPDQTEPEAVGADDSVMLIGFLHDRDAACPLCGYNLRGLLSNGCPECGSGLRLSVGLTEPFLRAWIAIVVSLSLPAGIGLLFLFALIKEEAGPRGMPLGMWIALGYFIAAVPALAIVLRERRRFLRLGKSLQIQAAVVVAIMTVGSFLLFRLSGR